MADKEEEVNLTAKDNLLGTANTVNEATNEEVSSNLETASLNINLSREESLPGNKDKVKIDILLKATGNAPIMKKKKWAVSQDQHIGWISEFIKKYLKLDPSEKLFLYINQTFAPAPDQTVRNLYDCYGTDGKLIIHYCKSQAWG